MTKNKSKFKGLFKGAALGFAFLMCGAFFPVSAVKAFAAEDFKGPDAKTNSTRIEVDGKVAKNGPQTSGVVKGNSFEIPQGIYYVGDTAHTIGSPITGTITESTVKVVYKATGEEVAVTDGSHGKEFIASKIGTYVIQYKVVDNGMTYAYDFAVESQIGEATFNFVENDKNIIPTIYDSKLTDKDIVLPLPSIKDEDGNVVLDPSNKEDLAKYLLDSKSHPTEGGFVTVRLTKGAAGINVEKADSNFVIKGTDLKKDEVNNTEFKVVYAYYQVAESTSEPVFISSTSKTFTVKKGYYYTNSEKSTSGYDLVADWGSTAPDNAVAGVEKELPAMIGKTKANNAPANETVPVHYDIKVSRDGKDVTADVLKDGKFKANAEGNYTFEYTVSDFYGHEVKTPNTTFTINNVKDSKQADVIIYDAGSQTVEADGTVKETAENKVPTKALNKNIIMYAISGHDNLVAHKDLTLSREIKRNSSTKFSVKNYNNYNLVFAPSATEKNNELAVYAQIAQDNYEIRKQMILDDADKVYDPLDGASVKEWMMAHNYLLVTTDGKDIAGNYIVAKDTLDENNKEVIQAMIEKGYAYVASKEEQKFSTGTYDFYYYANDNKNGKKAKYEIYSTEFQESFTDENVPSLTFSTNLQNTYRRDDVVEFDVASGSDTIDRKLDVLTAYRFINESGETIAHKDTNKTLEYVIAGKTNPKDANKWFVKDKDSKGHVESANWFFDKTQKTYRINLKNAPAATQKVEILAYAIDDNGNVGFFNKILNVSTTVDTKAPTLLKMTNVPTGAESHVAPKTISLPTLEFGDDRPDYMHASVEVYKIVNNGETETRQPMQSTDMSTRVKNNNTFVVEAGNLNVSTEGKYQVIVTVADAVDHVVSTYFTYNVTGSTVVEDPVIENSKSEPIEVEIDKPYALTAPKLSVSKSSSYGYIGLDEDGETSTNYTSTILSPASSSNYELNNYYFTGKATGTYTLQYEAYLIRYKTEGMTTKEAPQDGKLFLDADGKLRYQDSGKSYFVLMSETGNEENPYEIVITADEYGISDDVVDAAAVEDTVKLYVLKSNVQTITVADIVLKVSIDEGTYPEAVEKNKEHDPITIVKPQVFVSGADKGNGIDMKESNVQITRTRGSSTITLATISFEKWANHFENEDSNFEVDKDTNTIKLKLLENGKYTIKYSVQAVDHLGQKVGDPKILEHSILSGDVTNPEMKIDKKIVKNNYNLGDVLKINKSAITVSDNLSKAEDITIEYSLKNEAGEPVEAEKPEEGASTDYTEFALKKAGEYTLTITCKDEAGNKSTETVTFTVSAEKSKNVEVKDVLGGVLIGLSVTLLTGVVIYFVVSKVKLDKKEKSYKEKTNDKK